MPFWGGINERYALHDMMSTIFIRRNFIHVCKRIVYINPDVGIVVLKCYRYLMAIFFLDRNYDKSAFELA